MNSVTFHQLASIFTSAGDDVEKMKLLMQEIFTPAEIEDFIKRIALLKALKEGKTQRQIAKDFHLSLCKITRGAKLLKTDDCVIAKLI